MGLLDKLRLPSLDRVQNTRRTVTPKGSTVLERREKRTAKDRADDELRKACWDRDGGKSRASGVPLLRSHVDPRKRGQVAHLTARSTNPGEKRDLRRVVLLSAEEHELSDARTAPGGKPLLTIKGTDGNKAVTFTMHDPTGRVLWTRTSLPERPATGARSTTKRTRQP